MGEDFEIDLSNYGQNLINTQDYSVRNVSWSADSLPDGVILTPSGKLMGNPTTSGSYTINITVSNQAGRFTFPVSIVCGTRLPTAYNGYTRSSWYTSTGGYRHLSLKMYYANDLTQYFLTGKSTPYTRKWVPYLKADSYNLLRQDPPRFGVSFDPTVTYQDLVPLPGELGEIGGLDILLQYVSTSQTVYGNTRMILTRKSPHIITWVSPVLQNLGFSLTCTCKNLNLSVTRTMDYLKAAGTSYITIPQLELTCSGKEALGYDKATNSIYIGLHKTYRNHLWIAIQGESGGYIMFPVQVQVFVYSKSNLSRYETALDYDWGGGSKSPANPTGGLLYD